MDPDTKRANKDFIKVVMTLLRAEMLAGIFGLKLFIACVMLASFMMSAVWILGDSLSKTLVESGHVFLGGDVAVSSVNVPLEPSLENKLHDWGEVSQVIELRTLARSKDHRAAVELKALDPAYPLYGDLELQSAQSLKALVDQDPALPWVIVEDSLLKRLDVTLGETLEIGSAKFRIADVLLREPDRLSAGRFMVGPRVLISSQALSDSGLIQPGSLVEYRYRIKKTDDSPADLRSRLEQLKGDRGWEIETPSDAGDRVLRTVERATTFLGMAGIAAFLIGLTGAWAGAQDWIRRRARTIALYRLSGASSEVVLALHALILSLASLLALMVGLGAALGLSLSLLDMITARLHVPWDVFETVSRAGQMTLVILVGLSGCIILALSGVYSIAPGQAMRSGDARLQTDYRHALWGAGMIGLSIVVMTLSLPFHTLAALMLLGLGGGVLALVLAARSLALWAGRQNPQHFVFMTLCQSLKNPAKTASRTVAIGIGIIGITAVFVSQSALQTALEQELPERIPDLVLIDVKPDQVKALRTRIDGSDNFTDLQADPFMRMSITAVNGIPAQDALVKDDKAWVIEGDRSFSWTEEPTQAELLDGQWWPPDYAGPPLISPEEDVMEAFDLKVGDTMTYTFLGRSFTSEVVNIRKEYHRTFRPEYLMLASAYPFKEAPHTWVVSFKGKSSVALDQLIREISDQYPNITTIDIRPIVRQVQGVVTGTIQATMVIALLLGLAGALTLAALVASDVESRKKEALVFTLLGTSRREIALIRLCESVAIGSIAALLGGGFGLLGGYVIVTEAVRVDWSFSAMFLFLPLLIGVASALVSALVAGFGAAPRGRGQLIRHLAD